MHKKLASDLTSIAHSILQMKNKEDVFKLKQQAYEVYEKLSVLAYVEEYINNTPNPLKTKEALFEEVRLAEENRIEKIKLETPLVEEAKIVYQLEEEEDEIDETKVDETIAEELVKEKVEVVEDATKVNDVIAEEFVVVRELEVVDVKDELVVEEEILLTEEKDVIEQPFDEIESLLFPENDNVKNDVKDVGERKVLTLEEELQDTISVDVMADLFEKVDSKKSLNDHLKNTIQIDLNDRIAFVKHLFENDQNDFNRVVSQLNTFKTAKEAKKFVNKMIKPDYNWSDKEEYENRFFEIIERKFI